MAAARLCKAPSTLVCPLPPLRIAIAFPCCSRLFTSEARAHDALDNLIDTYTKVCGYPLFPAIPLHCINSRLVQLDHATAYIPNVHKLEVAIGQEEAKARLRHVKIEQVRKVGTCGSQSVLFGFCHAVALLPRR